MGPQGAAILGGKIEVRNAGQRGEQASSERVNPVIDCSG